MPINPLTAIDFYKADHRSQYPKGTKYVYSNFTPRSSRLFQGSSLYDEKIVFFGLQGFIKSFLIELWNKEFFEKSKDEVIGKYKKRMDTSLGEGAIKMDHIEDLHDLGYLPIKIKALPEGSCVNIGVPLFTIINTQPKFFWLTNYLETVLSCEIWKSCTTATIAREYRKIMEKYATETMSPDAIIQFQCHDFSMRGMSCLEDARKNGAGHLLSFTGTDSVTSIDYLEENYNSDSSKELIGCSVPATEHSVMCMGGENSEIDTFKRLITETYPSGIISIVSDTWDFWKVITEYIPQLKSEILSRTPNALGLSKVVIRPDSGDPFKIICGDEDAEVGSPAYLGAVECLWNTFGGTKTENGFMELDQHIGLIYGDSITMERADKILKRLAEKGFASSNIVFGVGSYTYQYNTRDVFGIAMKATWGVVNDEPREIFKDPKTDSGTKKSAKGLLKVTQDSNGNFHLKDSCTLREESESLLKTVFFDGKLTKEVTLSEVRKLVQER